MFAPRYNPSVLRQFLSLLWLLVGFIPAALGMLHNLVPYLLVRWIVAGSGKPAGLSTHRLRAGLPIFALWYAFVWWMLAGYFLPSIASVWISLMAVAGIFALSYWPRARVAAQLRWAKFRFVLEKKELQRLRANHFRIGRRLTRLSEKYRAFHPATDKAPARPWQWYAKRTLHWGVSGLLISGATIYGVTKWQERGHSILAQQDGLDLTAIPPQEFAHLLSEDAKSLAEILGGLSALEEKSMRVQSELISGERNFYSQRDNDAIRQLLFTYLTYRTELLRLIWKYQNYADMGEEKVRLETFLLELAAASALCESSFKLVTRFAPSADAIRKLNEGEQLWEIPSGLYDTLRGSLADEQNRVLLKEAWGHYDQALARFSKAGLVEPMPYSLFHEIIRQSRETTAKLDQLAEKWTLQSPVERAHKTGKSVLYRGQSLLSTWVGDTRVRQPRQGKPLIQPEQLESLRAKLKPGDILVERQNWYLSRAFMPGYWAHAALYVGTTNDLVRMGLDKDPRVQKFWRQFAMRDSSGHEHVILEAVPRGVRMTTLEHCIGVADSAAVLRPRVSTEQVPEIIARAFVHVGKPYDFEFDFFSTDKLVCTELVYRCFDQEIEFPLVEVLGRKTLPPTELVRKFVNERSRPDAQLQFVAFLDGEESKGRAFFKPEEEFLGTIDRPSLTWLQKR
jgi:hypothetical protein